MDLRRRPPAPPPPPRGKCITPACTKVLQRMMIFDGGLELGCGPAECRPFNLRWWSSLVWRVAPALTATSSINMKLDRNITTSGSTYTRTQECEREVYSCDISCVLLRSVVCGAAEDLACRVLQTRPSLTQPQYPARAFCRWPGPPSVAWRPPNRCPILRGLGIALRDQTILVNCHETD